MPPASSTWYTTSPGTGEKHATFTLSEPSGGLVFFELGGDDVVYSTAHIAKVWTLEPTALADARQALVNIRAGQELKDEFEGKTAADVEQKVLRLEEHFRASTVELAGESQPEPEPEPEPEPDATVSTAEQLAAKDALIAAQEAEIATLRSRLAGATSAHEHAAEGVPPL